MGELMIVECDCGAFEEFDSSTGPKQFQKLDDESCACPFCETWYPEPPEGYVKPVFIPPSPDGKTNDNIKKDIVYDTRVL